MPLYQQIIVALPKLSKGNLTELFRKHARTVLANGGNLRGVENHGIRPLPEKSKRKYATEGGDRYFWEARYVTATFDASPACLEESERMLRNEEGVLRSFTVKVDQAFEKSKASNYKNPYGFNSENKPMIPPSNTAN